MRDNRPSIGRVSEGGVGMDQGAGETDGVALTAAAAKAIRAAVERIVPSGETPGAREAGTAGYVLTRAAAWPSSLSLYRLLAVRLADAAAAVDPTTPFGELPSTSQDAILSALERDGDPGFRRIVVDTMEGFYGDPSHGGNAGAVSWGNIGFPGPTGGAGYEPPLGWYDANTEPFR